MTVWPLPRISFRELSTIEEKRPVALLTNEATWAALSSQLTLPVLIQAEPVHQRRDLFDYLAANFPTQAKVIYAVGSGAPIDAGKLIAARNQVPLVIVPTALDSTELFSPTALVADKDGERTRLVEEETGPATEVIIDWDLIMAAPAERRGAGIVDLITVVTGLLDWRYAAQKGRNPRSQRFVPWAASVVSELAKQAIKSAPAIGQGDQEALQTLLDLLLTLAQLSNQLGHMRAYQGSEHHLARILRRPPTSRAYTPNELPRACCSRRHCTARSRPPCATPCSTRVCGWTRSRPTDFNLVIDNLANHLVAYEFPYSVLNDIEPGSEQVAGAIEAAGLTIEVETWLKPEETLAYILADASAEAPHEEKTYEESTIETPVEAGVERIEVEEAQVEITPGPEAEAELEAAADTQPGDDTADLGNG